MIHEEEIVNNNLKLLNELKNNSENNTMIKRTYTYRYRILKTALLHWAYISLGINTELFTVVYEDLKILLNINYEPLARILAVKIGAYLMFMFFIGFIIDRYVKYSDVFMSISTITISAGNYLS